MKQFRVLLIAIMVLNAAGAQNPASAKFKLLYTFPGGPGVPTNLHEVSPGLFYGSAAGNYGTVGGEIFSITSAGTFQNISQFPGSLEPDWVMPAEGGKLFGSESQGGNYQSSFTMKFNGSASRFSTQCERGPNSANVWPGPNCSVVPSSW